MNYLERRFPRLHYVRFKDEADRAATNTAIARRARRLPP